MLCTVGKCKCISVTAAIFALIDCKETIECQGPNFKKNMEKMTVVKKTTEAFDCLPFDVPSINYKRDPQ